MSPREVRFWVAGDPRPKGSKTMMHTRTGQAYMHEADATRLRAWMRGIRDEAANHATTWMRQADVVVKLSFTMRATSPRHVGWHTKAPDLDKLVRAVLDALQQGKRPMLSDDGAVAKILAAKRWGDYPGVWITVADAGPCYDPRTPVTADQTGVSE